MKKKKIYVALLLCTMILTGCKKGAEESAVTEATEAETMDMVTEASEESASQMTLEERRMTYLIQPEALVFPKNFKSWSILATP